MVLNAIDGMLAREFNQKTSLGAILNETGDSISNAALYLAFVLILWLPLSLVSSAIAVVFLLLHYFCWMSASLHC